MENQVSYTFCVSLPYLCPVEAYDSKGAADEVRSTFLSVAPCPEYTCNTASS